MAVAGRIKKQEPRTKNQFGRIGVLMGGPSSEREISLKSGSAVFEAFKSSNLDVVVLDITESDSGKARTQIEKARIKIAFIALHGKFGEDGTVQKLLQEMRVPYTGSGIEASRLALDKIAARKRFKEAGLSVPEAEIVNKNIPFKKKLGKFPVVVKPATSGSSIGLSIVEEEKDLWPALREAFVHDENVLIEEYIQGRECTVGILEDKPLAVVEVIPKRKFFDYQAKYTKGLTEYIVPAAFTQDIYSKVQETALAAHKALGCYGFSRVDMIIDNTNRLFVLELNTIPGMTQTSLLPKAAQAVGVNFIQLCMKLLSLALTPRKQDRKMR
ncbi:MAG: D-alanine--D-alanine ligase [Candidatus Omnitrophota bacterium]|nr:D-alanine--D-alanine ligase [Candidatus Omnitrophota bacterium]